MGKKWITNHIRDRYYRAAKKSGYRSRAAYKLLQIQKRFKILRPGSVVLDLCCSPGSWLQVIRRFVGERGIVVGVDLVKVPKLNGVLFIQADIYDSDIVKKIVQLSNREKFDVVLSDCSPKLSGVKDLDNFRQIALAERSLEIALSLLKKNGTFVTKVFQGQEFEKYSKKVKDSFLKVFFFKPFASRQKSPEMYIIAKILK
ncbi:MAG: RlmE family RNA methyltransferase [Candidatus Asgardarchaeia archaeon]